MLLVAIVATAANKDSQTVHERLPNFRLARRTTAGPNPLETPNLAASCLHYVEGLRVLVHLIEANGVVDFGYSEIIGAGGREAGRLGAPPPFPDRYPSICISTRPNGRPSRR